MATDLPDDVESPAEGEVPEPGSIEASYLARMQLRRADLGEGVANDYPEPTIAELEEYLTGALMIGAPAFTATVSAERLDK